MIIEKTIYSDMLFPSKAEGYYNYKVIDTRIKRNLNEDNRSWATELIYSIVKNDNYINIKKTMKRLPQKNLIAHHEILQIALDDNIDFNSLIDQLININSQIQYLIKTTLNIKLPLVEMKKEVEEMVGTIEILENELLDENSDIVKQIYSKFDLEFFRFIVSPYFKLIIKKERNKLHSTILHSFRNTKLSLLSKYEKQKNEEFNNRRMYERTQYLRKTLVYQHGNGPYRKNYNQ